MATAKLIRSASSPPNPFGIPDFDLSKVLSQFGLPSADFDKLVDEQRKNIEAVCQANQSVMSGWETLSQKQAQIFQETIERWQQAMQQGSSGNRPTPEEQVEMVRRGFQAALDNMRALAEIATKYQNEAYEIVRQRMVESIEGYFVARDRKNE